MASDLKARPTSFGGIEFRSKSEAMLACAMAAAHQVFEYEPEWLRVGEYTPDFITVYNPAYGPRKVYRSRELCTSLYEYKPSLPTRTYLNELHGRMEACMDLIGMRRDRVIPTVVIGNDWNQNRCVMRWMNESGEWRTINGWECIGLTDAHIQYARDYRFDLA